MGHTVEHATCTHCGLRAHVGAPARPLRLVCESAAMQELLCRAARFAPSDAPVVVLGESGTGKEVVARALHINSARAEHPFVAVNVAALPAELLESELFGHARGAFTGAHQAHKGLFESAHRGMLFLDEIGEMPLALQAKLLRALQEGEVRRLGDTRATHVDVRVVCATHRDLSDLVRRGLFREDLFYRLKVLTLRVSPLRERREDVMPLARQFLAGERTRARRFSPAAERALLAYPWPGNVRELQNAVRHGAALATADTVEREHLPDELLGEGPPRGRGVSPAPLRPLADVEREHVLGVLAACGGQVGEAARVLGIGRNTLWRRLKRYG